MLIFRYCRCLRLRVGPSVYQSQACPRDNSWPVQSRNTKFAPEVQNTLRKTPNVFGVDCPWPSRSNWTLHQDFIMPKFTTRVYTTNGVNIKQSWPRLLHGTNCFSFHPLDVIIYLECFSAPTLSQSQLCANILIWAADGISAFNVALALDCHMGSFCANNSLSQSYDGPPKMMTISAISDAHCRCLSPGRGALNSRGTQHVSNEKKTSVG